MFGNLEVTALDSGAVLWKSNRLEKGDQLLLPVDTLVFLLKVHERIASFAVPNVGQTENFGKKERERAYKAVIINGIDVLLLGNHVAKATASGILEGNAGSLGAQNPVDVIAVVELIVKPVGDPDNGRAGKRGATARGSRGFGWWGSLYRAHLSAAGLRAQMQKKDPPFERSFDGRGGLNKRVVFGVVENWLFRVEVYL
nr:hypothetical protein C4D60_Mb10t20400 [Ipomoea batatas]